MKIEILPYDPAWPTTFRLIKDELEFILKDFNPTIEHFGSTSVPNLAAKPTIDILVGITNISELDKTIEPMLKNHFIYYEIFNEVMPERRLFVGLKDKKQINKFSKIYKKGDDLPKEQILNYRLCHVHVWQLGCDDWIRHIAFRDYLINHPDIKSQYEILKKKLSKINWVDGMKYNNGKNSFIKTEQAKAIKWYKQVNNLG